MSCRGAWTTCRVEQCRGYALLSAMRSGFGGFYGFGGLMGSVGSVGSVGLISPIALKPQATSLHYTSTTL